MSMLTFGTPLKLSIEPCAALGQGSLKVQELAAERCGLARRCAWKEYRSPSACMNCDQRTSSASDGAALPPTENTGRYPPTFPHVPSR